MDGAPADGYVAHCGILAGSKAGTGVLSLGHDIPPGDGDGATVDVFAFLLAASYSRGISASEGKDLPTADGDGTATAVLPTADASAIVAAMSLHLAVSNGDFAAICSK